MAINTTYKITKGTPESLLSLNRINDQDLPLVQRLELDTVFKPSQNRLDVFFYSLDGRYLSSKIDSRTYSVVQGGSRNAGQIEDITLNPEKDSIDAGYPNGDVNVLYNFVNNLLTVNNTQPKLFIESISPDRTEIRALTNDVSRKNIVRFIDNIKGRLNDTSYFEDFRLNFGRNQLLIGINIDRVDFNDSQAIIIKLYEPLPAGIDVKDTFLLEELVGDSVLYQVATEVSRIAVEDQFNLRGPNYDIELVEENNNPTGYLNYDELFSYPVTNSYYEVYSLFNEKGAQISLDHTDFNEFVQFSSAEERLKNFYYKASLLESYRNQINARNTYTGSLVENIKGIVSNFDHYDRYLYYETGSWAWPKSTSTRPYTLYSTGSTQVQDWYTNILLSASDYDASNQDRLINAIPSFVREDSNNAPYSLFTDMIGQHFDNLWIYSKAVTDKFDADNRLEFGISKDLVRDAIENFGIKLYNNNEALENLFAAFTGETYSTGSESTVTSLIVAVEGSGSLSGSVGNEHLQPMPKSSYQKEVYKRIYHNIPLLLKSKGTERGLRALINSFGIPYDILDIRTFGGAENTASTFYGPGTDFTSSLDKIRISNTNTVVSGSTLSTYTSVVQPGKDYSTDLHTVEIGFSPGNSLDNFIKSHPSMSTFNLDEYIGDPGAIYSSSYSSLNSLAETVFTSGSSYANPYNAKEFVRLIKFFDNSLFRMVKEFLPARSNVSTGIVIKPHLLNRSKIKQPQVGWSNQTSPGFIHSGTQLDYTGSYYSTNFSIDGEIDTAFITGSTGLNSSYTSSYTETYTNPSGGYQTVTRNNHDEPSYTGEFSGSIIPVSNGSLNRDNSFKQNINSGYYFNFFPSSSFTSLSSFIQADFSFTDNVTLWISQSIVSNYTSSTIEALAIPTITANMGNISSVLENATEIVFEYVKFDITDEFTTTPRRFSFVNNLGQELQDENIQLSVTENTSNLTHEINFLGDTVGQATAYSASLEIDFADIPNNTQVDIPFNYQVLHTSQGGTESKLIVQLRDKTTDLPYSGMSFSLDMNNFESGNELLTFSNETGATLENVEFLFRVKVESTGNPPNNIPQINLTGLKAIYKGDGEGFYNSSIETKKRLEDAYYFKLKDVITIPTSSLVLGESSSLQYNVGFFPEPNELFRFNNYGPISNNISSIRKSNIRLSVDEKTYTPTSGFYTSSFVPANYSILSSSIANGVEGLDERFFAEVQDSNYYATGWRNGRYDGTKTNNISKGVSVLGQEPALNFSSFNGSLFNIDSTTAEIQSIFSGSDKKEDDVEVYYSTYGLNKKSNLVIGSGTDTSIEINSTLITRSEVQYKINLNDEVLGGGTYSGSIGPVGSSNLIKINYTLLLQNLNQIEIASATSQHTVKLFDGVVQKANEAIDITGITQGTEQSYTVYLSPTSDIANAALQFNFTGFEGDGAGSPDIDLNIVSIERFSNSTLIPSSIDSENILSTGTYQKTILREQTSTSPTNPTGYQRLVNSKIYRFDTGQVYTTNDKGIVTNIE